MFLLPLAVSLIALTPAAPAAAPADWPPEPPQTSEFLKVADVEVGQTAVAYTVFKGDAIESFSGTVLGVVRNFFGPQSIRKPAWLP